MVKNYNRKFKELKKAAEEVYYVPFHLMNPEPIEFNFCGNADGIPWSCQGERQVGMV